MRRFFRVLGRLLWLGMMGSLGYSKQEYYEVQEDGRVVRTIAVIRR